MNTERILDEFPAPSFRGAQKQALLDIKNAYDAGNDVVLVRAPTGSGKSLLARAIAGCAKKPGEGDPTRPMGAYYTTPQVSQLDDVADDELLEDLQIIRGKRNYSCILPGESTTPVNQAPCAREKGFDCNVKHRCPYFSDRAIAANRSIAAMTLAYFMQTAGTEAFGQRDVVVIDEAHGLAEWAEMYATIDIQPHTVPVWEQLNVPEIDGLDRAVSFADGVKDICTRRKDELLRKVELSPAEVAERDRLQKLIADLKWFVEDYRNPESPTTWVVDQPDGEGTGVTVKPMNPERYLRHTVWDRGTKFALLSATILNREAFCRQVGLDPKKVALVDVPHTFPLENRPLYDVTQGKMTYEHRKQTLPKIARLIVQLMQKHPDEKGIIHAHSYAIQAELERMLGEFGVAGRVQAHSRENRDADLESWKATDDPDVFLSVKMEEALDLKGDLARWQVICKAPYLNTSDSRVARRLEDGQWAWYHRAALRTVIQGCGRVVRAPDDYGATYLADSSLLDLFERAEPDMPPWFKEQVDAMTVPDLPDFDGKAAAGEKFGSPSKTSRRAPTRNSTRSSGGRSSSGSSSSSSTAASSDGSRRKGNPKNKSFEDHPLSDIWSE
ncbi:MULTISPECIES: ATP-dependent DNA helicase [unclassified Haladaptatus]|uniref:ATP-dependent DNA helicase n=1 Tax=unclassified Haladaptatus TaxID=2622732 RepID=UPI0023E8EAB1|nr:MULTISPECIES: ATP-dependent DNA helicase [unclassified Haladaptatus]